MDMHIKKLQIVTYVDVDVSADLHGTQTHPTGRPPQWRHQHDTNDADTRPPDRSTPANVEKHRVLVPFVILGEAEEVERDDVWILVDFEVLPLWVLNSNTVSQVRGIGMRLRRALPRGHKDIHSSDLSGLGNYIRLDM